MSWGVFQDEAIKMLICYFIYSVTKYLVNLSLNTPEKNTYLNFPIFQTA